MRVSERESETERERRTERKIEHTYLVVVVSHGVVVVVASVVSHGGWARLA